MADPNPTAFKYFTTQYIKWTRIVMFALDYQSLKLVHKEETKAIQFMILKECPSWDSCAVVVAWPSLAGVNVDKMLLIIDLNFAQHSHKTFLCQLQFRLSTDNLPANL